MKNTDLPRRVKDMTGLRFGRLVVLQYAGTNRHRAAQWAVRCDCGVEKVVLGYGLRQRPTISCGCYGLEQRVKATRKAPGHAGFTRLIVGYKKDAERRGYAFELTDAEFRELTSQNCYYCNRTPRQISWAFKNYTPTGAINSIYAYNGVDRYDNTQGYVRGNCVPCCFICNDMKGVLHGDVFKDAVFRIFQHLFGESLPKVSFP